MKNQTTNNQGNNSFSIMDFPTISRYEAAEQTNVTEEELSSIVNKFELLASLDFPF